MKKLTRVLIWLAVVLIIVLNFINLYLIMRQDEKHDSNKNSIASTNVKIQEVERNIYSKIDSLEKSLSNQPAPRDGKDGRDGRDAVDGKDSLSTSETRIIQEKTIEKVPVNGKDGENGITPIIRCNQSKNRWEYKLLVEDNWQLLNNEVVKCTI